MCPDCNVEIHPLGISHLVTPFWKQLPHFLSYPLKSATLGFIVLIGIITGLAHYFLTFNAISTALSFLPVYLVCLIGVLIYCNNVFQKTRKGDLTPPFTDISMEGIPWPVLKQTTLFLILHLLGYSAITLMGPVVGLAAYEFAKFLTPAMFLLLLVNNSLISAINPLLIFLLIKKIARSYLLIYLIFSVLLHLVLASVFILGRFDFALPLVPILFYSLLWYFLVIIYHLFGYVLLQFNEELGVSIDYITFLRFVDKAHIDQRITIDPLYNDAYLLVSQRKPDKALELIRDECKDGFTNPDLAQLYLKLLDIQDENDRLRWVAGPITDLLLSKGHVKEAVNLFLRSLKDQPLVFPQADSLYKLNHLFVRNDKQDEAFQCSELLISKYPDSVHAPELHLKCAGISITRLKDRKKAAGLLNRFLKLYPDHPRSGEAHKMIAWLKKTGTSKHRVPRNT
jgi:tetratricopeptide (TPR) repeat protein